jgi:pimeloyl-ACP methyl ester carboxylesterase
MPLRRHENWCNGNLFSGHSFGSGVAYMYSAMFPDDVEAYVSIDCGRTLMMMYEEELLETTRYTLDRALAVEKRLAFDQTGGEHKETKVSLERRGNFF